MVNPEMIKEIVSIPKETWYKETSSENLKGYNLDSLDKPMYQSIQDGGGNYSFKVDSNLQFRGADLLPQNNGTWSGEVGNSTWKPDSDYIPQKGNPDKQTWEKIETKHGTDGIPFKDGEPDFSAVMAGEVEIDDFTTERYKNFNQADEALAEKWNTSPEDVKAWREENQYSWHECKDCKTMQLVPHEVHINIPHDGGISVKKREQSLSN